MHVLVQSQLLLVTVICTSANQMYLRMGNHLCSSSSYTTAVWMRVDVFTDCDVLLTRKPDIIVTGTRPHGRAVVSVLPAECEDCAAIVLMLRWRASVGCPPSLGTVQGSFNSFLDANVVPACPQYLLVFIGNTQELVDMPLLMSQTFHVGWC